MDGEISKVFKGGSELRSANWGQTVRSEFGRCELKRLNTPGRRGFDRREGSLRRISPGAE
jgi:hypothetical protein